MNDMAHRSAMDIRSKSEKTLGKRSGKTGNNKSVDTTLKSINTINAPDSMYIKFAAARRGFPKLNCVIALILLIPSLLFFYCFMNLCYLSHYTIFIVSMGIQKMEIQTGLKRCNKKDIPSFSESMSFLVGEGGFEPPKSSDNRFTVCPHWPLGNSPIPFGSSREPHLL